MTKYKNEGKMYLSMYPDVAKHWINECIACHRQGYKPEMPEKLDHIIVRNNLMSYFQPLAVNDVGICEQCAKWFEPAATRQP